VVPVTAPPYGETVTVVRPPGRDRYGDPLPGSATEVDYDGCAWWPRTSTEVAVGQNTLIEGIDVFFPDSGTDVRATDRLRLRGVLYDVEGDPGEWRSELTGTEAGTQVSAKRVTG
jgi:hypothetical protein